MLALTKARGGPLTQNCYFTLFLSSPFKYMQKEKIEPRIEEGEEKKKKLFSFFILLYLPFIMP